MIFITNMKISKPIVFFGIILFLGVQIQFSQFSQEKFVKGELLVKFREPTNSSLTAKINREMDSEFVERLGDKSLHRIELSDEISVETAIAKLNRYPEIEYAQPNFYYRLAVSPDDTRFSELWGMEKISAPAAWDITSGSSDTIVAVIDTGIRYTHEDLAANMWTNSGETPNNGIDDDNNGFIDDVHGYDFRFNDSDPDDEFGSGHGTHVAGTIGAVGNNSLGVTGVNWNVRLMAIKIYSSTGTDTTSAMLINAYNYVRMMKERGENIRVTNNSYSGCNEACSYDQATKDALDAMGNAGILNVFAAGNDARNVETNPAYPGSYNSSTVLTVASSTSTDTRSGFSNFGSTRVDLAAPGSGILSTTRTAANYGNSSGTSMASPHAAGAAALLSSHNPSLTNASLKATLMNTVDVLANWDGVVKTSGRLNVANALQNQTVCNFGLSQNAINVRTKGGIYTVDVSAGENCDFFVKSNDRWIYLMNSTDALSGNSTVTFRVTVNPTISRTGTISIAGQTFTVTQSRN